MLVMIEIKNFGDLTVSAVGHGGASEPEAFDVEAKAAQRIAKIYQRSLDIISQEFIRGLDGAAPEEPTFR
jgi:hypothetical protein